MLVPTSFIAPTIIILVCLHHGSNQLGPTSSSFVFRVIVTTENENGGRFRPALPDATTALNVLTGATNKGNAGVLLRFGVEPDIVLTSMNHRPAAAPASATVMFTCCGWSLMTTSERVLGYLAAVGGFAGLVQAVLASIPPHHHASVNNVTPK